MMSPPLQFLNVDLDLEHTRSFEPLVRELSGRLLVLHAGPGSMRGVVPKAAFAACLESNRSARHPLGALRAIAAAVDALSSAQRSVWRSLRFKEINIGYERARASRHATGIDMDAEFIATCARLGCSLAITIYERRAPKKPAKQLRKKRPSRKP